MSGKRRGGGSPPEAPYIPPQPPAPELMDVIDKLAGIETITVTGADGKKRRVTQRLPLTPEEQELNNQAETLLKQAVTNIQTLYNHDPASVVNYQPFIEAFSSINKERMQDLASVGDFKDISEQVEKFKKLNTDLALKEFDNSSRMFEDNLAHRGVSDSSEATQLRAAMADKRARLVRELDVSSNDYGLDLRDRQIQRESNLYALREQGRSSRLQEAEAGYNLERQKADDIEKIRQDAIGENMNMMDIASGIKGNDFERSKIGLANAQNAVSTFGAQAKNQNQRFSNDIARVSNNYGNEMKEFNNTPASFRTRARDMGYSFAGQAAGRLAGKAMSKFGI